MKNKIMVEVKGLNYTYSDGNTALKDISFKLYDNQTLGLVGPNGAGKSTLLHVLMGILPINGNSGHVMIEGKPLIKKNLDVIRRRLGLVFQDPDDQLFMSTVFDDVAFGPINMGFTEEKVRKRVALALRKVGLENYHERCPHHLSFGEKKRVALASVLSMHPEILLLDEPTANLDPRARKAVIQLMNKFHSVKIISSHDIEMLIETCDRILFLDEGELIANGDPKKIFCNKKLLKSHGLEMPMALQLLGPKAYEMIKAQGVSK